MIINKGNNLNELIPVHCQSAHAISTETHRDITGVSGKAKVSINGTSYDVDINDLIVDKTGQAFVTRLVYGYLIGRD